MELPARYEASVEEPVLQKLWVDEGIYRFDKVSKKPVFSIDTPPPTVSGRMHMGHAFSYSQGDFIARYRRMRGDNVFYPWGTDDNGLPTERLIEKQEGIRAKDMERSAFRKTVLSSVKQQLAAFNADWVRLGISAEFANAYSTIDEHCQRTSQASFIDLYEKGLVKRQETPISWCMTCQTAIAQAEFDNVPLTSTMNTISFKDEDGCELLIMTTRPELIPACVAICYHPQDERYASLRDKRAVVPLSAHSVPILSDESVDREKGTGLMMVCTFGDKEDVEKSHRYKLSSRVIFTKDGRMNDSTPYEGLTIREARKQVLVDLDGQGFLKRQEQITHAVNVHERCGTEIEFLETTQWFVNILEHKQELLDVGTSITWYPSFMKTRYAHWVENLNWDWCISRQRPYGVPFPVWYAEDGSVVVASREELPVDPTETAPLAWKARKDALVPERDVMDTWATSSTTPQIALEWVRDEAQFKLRFPMSVRLQAHDIIRTWAFYTIVKAFFHHGTRPWDDIVISGHALDPRGKKMSKSKGNAVDPNAVIQRYGADALRFWAASTKLGEDLPWQEKDVVTGQKTVTKLWNASKFCLLHLKSYDGNVPESELELVDRWLLARLNEVVLRATESFDRYEYSRTKAETENFFWNVFCDYYLELVKDRLYNPERSAEEKRSALFTLYTALLAQLKLFAPIMPHVTDHIYRLYFAEREGCRSVHVSSWPVVRSEFVDDAAVVAGEVVVSLLGVVRRHKSERQLSLRAEIPSASIACSVDVRKSLQPALKDFLATARLLDVTFVKGVDTTITFE